MKQYSVNFLYANGIQTIASGLQVSALNPVDALRSLYTGRTYISSDVIGVLVNEEQFYPLNINTLS